MIIYYGASKLDTKKAVVYVNGEEYGTYSLDEENQIDINGKNILKIEDENACMIYADCPDKLCINLGKIKDMTKSIICLPNRVVVKIEE